MLTLKQIDDLKTFIKHPIQKVLLLTHEDPPVLHQLIDPIVKQKAQCSVFIDTQQQTNIEDVLNTSSLSSPLIIVFANADIENLYMKYQLERWQVKVIIMCDQQLLHPTLNCSLYFAPVKNGKTQKHLFSQIKFPNLPPVSKS
jgi:hypothetical protein